MLLASGWLTILEFHPRLLGELDLANAMISAETESLRRERNYEYSFIPSVPLGRAVGRSRLDAGKSRAGADLHKPT